MEGLLGETILVNVYVPQAPSEKKVLWNDLLNLRSRPGNWVIFGDFNTIRRVEERFKSTFCPSIATAFNKFIRDAGLLELNMGVCKFTYLCNDGIKLSKLDNFLICPNIMNPFPSASVIALPREYSDHLPILLRPCYLDFRPPSFRFFNSWLYTSEFDNIVIDAWNNFNGNGAADRYLSDKLRVVKKNH